MTQDFSTDLHGSALFIRQQSTVSRDDRHAKASHDLGNFFFAGIDPTTRLTNPFNARDKRFFLPSWYITKIHFQHGVFIDGDRTIDQLATNDLPGAVFYGAAFGHRAGVDVNSAGDFNQDGFGDILVVVPGESRLDRAGRERLGVVYLIFGDTHLYNTRYWAHQILWETGEQRESPIYDDDYGGRPVIHGLDLSADVLEGIYLRNACELLPELFSDLVPAGG